MLRCFVIALAGLASFSLIGNESAIEHGSYFDRHEIVAERVENGETISVTNTVTVLQPGLNYFSAEENLWKPSSDQIDIAETGAKFTKGPFKIDFAPNYNIACPVLVTLPNGSALRLKTIGIALTDSNTDSIWLGETKDTAGVLLGNAVHYPDAFSGIQADIRIRVFTGGFESDVILRENPTIDFEGLHLDPAKCRLEIWHEILDLPASDVQSFAVMRDDGSRDSDVRLHFGEMVMSEGSAFLTETPAGPAPIANQEAAPERIRVTKEIFEDSNHKRFLIESIPYAAARPALQTLPQQEHAMLDKTTIDKFLEDRSTRLARQKKSRRSPISLAFAAPSRPQSNRIITAFDQRSLSPKSGYLFDYTVLSAVTNMTLAGGTTYWITNTTSATLLSGTTTIEGNTVIKFAPYSSGSYPRMDVLGTIDCKTTPYAPAIFTAETDNSIGDNLGSTSTAANFGFVQLYLPAGITNTAYLHDLRFSYGRYATLLDITNSVTLENIQANSSLGGIFRRSGPAAVRNYLAVNTGSPFYTTAADIVAEHVTVHHADKVFNFITTPGTLSLTNSLLVCITNSSTYSTNFCRGFASDSGIFQTNGAGEHYLASGSTNRNAGMDVSATTAAILAVTTTFVPVDKSGVVSSNINLLPQNFGDTVQPDLGYHYPIIDFMVDGFGVTDNYSLTLSNNVVVATYNGNGLITSSGSAFESEGIPPGMNRIIRYNCVQEKPTSIGGGTAYSVLPLNSGTATIRFTEFSGLSGYHLYDQSTNQFDTLSVRDSIFRGSQVYFHNPNSGAAAINLTNNIFERSTLHLKGPNVGNFFNNLYFGNTVFIDTVGYSTNFTFADNAFDNAYIDLSGTVVNANNGYLNYSGAVSRLYPTNSFDQIVVSFLYTNGPLGRFYQFSNKLIDSGSRSATNAGLFHYTTRDWQQKESNSIVDIGAHYIALNSAGLPNDDDGDGVADYIEDANGNGSWDTGETRWTTDDPDYDGVPTFQEIIDGTDPYDPKSVAVRQLGHWKFDSTSFLGESIDSKPQPIPLVSNNVTTSTSWNGTAATYSVSGSSKLGYRDVETNLFPNINARNGTVRFWFKPNWSTGSAPSGNLANPAARFLQVGSWGTGNDLQYWDFGVNADGSQLFFGSDGPDYSHDNYFPVSFVQGRWYQIALSYTGTNIAAYVNGNLVGTGTAQPVGYVLAPGPYVANTALRNVGYGVYQWPAEFARSMGMGVGNVAPLAPGGGDAILNGQMEELETFNYALTPQQIAKQFPNFQVATSSTMTDSDYDGRSDMLESNVDGTTTTDPNSFLPVRLGYFRFNDSSYTGEQGQLPTVVTNITQESGWSGNYLQVPTTSWARLTYNDVETNGWANFNARRGSMRLWFKPNWQVGSPTVATFAYMGSADESQKWELRFENSDNTIRLITKGAGGSRTNFSAPYIYDNSRWLQIVVTYNTNVSKMFVDGNAVVTNGTGVIGWPDSTARANGLVIGNKTGGGHPAIGYIDEVETFNYELSTSEIADGFAAFPLVDYDANGVADVLEDISLHDPQPFTGVPFGITGVIEAEQFDRGGYNKAYYNVATNAVSDYRATGMLITAATNTLGTNDLGGGYCLDNLRAGEWVQYTIDVRKTRTYWIEPRAAGIGSNGWFNIEFYTNSVKYTETGPIKVTSLDWTNLGVKNISLDFGLNVMKVIMLTNGVSNNVDSGAVAKLNYVTIYPSWNEGVTNTSYFVNIQASDLSAGTTWSDALTNALVIQSKLDSTLGVLADEGSVITLPSGTYFVAQPNTNVTNDAWQHCAMQIPRNNIEIRGAGKTNTTLIAFNRATSIFCIGSENVNNTARTNVTFRDMTLEGRPHLVGYTNVGNIVTNYYEKGSFGGDYAEGFGALLAITGGGDQFTRNVLVTNCLFRNADRAINVCANTTDMLVRNNEFLNWINTNGSYNLQTNTGAAGEPISANTTPTPSTSANISGYGEGSEGIVIVDNAYQGNPNITSTVTYEDCSAPDGFVWIKVNGNYYVGRNTISNYSLEAIQFNAGPFAVGQNVYKTFIHDGSSCALNGDTSWHGLNTDPRDDFGSFVGNSVDGGRHGIQTPESTAHRGGRINFCGNKIRLELPFNRADDIYGAAASLGYTAHLNMAGNALTDGHTAIYSLWTCTNAFVLKNDFSGARQGGIFMDSGTPISQIFAKNILNSGVSYHMRAPLSTGNHIFSEKNTFQTSTNVVLDGIGLPIHLVP